MPRNWQALTQGEGFSNVMRLVHLAMRQDNIDQDAIRSALVKARRVEYEATLSKMAAEIGCDRSALVSEGDTLNELNQLSTVDAQSMINTYNYDLAVAIITIRTETPTANRHVYAKRLATWDSNRSEWKNKQVAMNTVLTSRSMAQRDFMRLNTNLEGKARLIGPDPAAEPICQGWLNRGLVPADVAADNPSPFHPNCPHSWEFSLGWIDDRDKDCEGLWMG